MAYDPEMTLYGKYKLKDLTITSTGMPNMPTSDTDIQNLRWLAKVLEQLEVSIGPFTVLSAFRSSEIQDAVKQPSQTKKSFHEVGMACDFYPTTMTIDDYFGKLITSEWLGKLGEIILKPTQNALHISLPTARTQGKLMILEPPNYRLLTDAEIAAHSGPYRASMSATKYANNDQPLSMQDPSGGVFSDNFLGMFGVYDLAPTGDVSLEMDSSASSGSNKMLIAGAAALAALLAAAVIAS